MPDLEEELFPNLTATGETEAAAAERAKELTQAAPPAPRPLSTPFADKPWHQQWADVGKDIMGSPQFTAVQHLTPWSDEVSAGMMNTEAPSAEEMYGPDKSLWPKDLPPEITGEEKIPDQNERRLQGTWIGPKGDQPDRYAAGSRAKDTHKVLSAEKDERAGRDPKAALGGGVLGGAFESMLTGGLGPLEKVAGVGKAGVQVAKRMAPNLLKQGATNTASIVSDQLGEGTGGVGERSEQAVERFKNAPLWAQGLLGLSAISPLLGKRAASKAAQQQKFANETTARIGIPADELHKIAQNSNLGLDVVNKIGGDARVLGLHEGKFNFDAETMQRNAKKARETAQKVMQETEPKLRAQGAPVDYRPIVNELEEAADETLKRTDQDAWKPRADFMRKQAQDMRERTTKVPVHGPPKQIEPTVEALAQHQKEMLQHTKDVNKEQAKHAAEVEKVARQDAAAKDRYNKTAATNLQKNIDAQNAHAAKVEKANTAQIKALQAHDKRVAAYNKAIELPEKPKGKNGKPATQAQLDKYQRAYDTAVKNKETLAIPLKPNAPVLEPPQTFRAPDRPQTLPPPPAPAARTPPAAPEPQLEWPAPFDTGTRPFGEAQDDLRGYYKNIDFTREGGGEAAPMKEEVRKGIAGPLLGNIETGLDEAASRGDVDPDVVEQWRGPGKKNFATAATFETPAMAMAFKDYGGKSKIKDLASASLLGTAVGSAPVAGAAAAIKQAGKALGARANVAAGRAEVNRNLAANTPYIASTQRRTATAGEKKELNDSLKDQLAEAMRSGTDWFKTWFK